MRERAGKTARPSRGIPLRDRRRPDPDPENRLPRRGGRLVSDATRRTDAPPFRPWGLRGARQTTTFTRPRPRAGAVRPRARHTVRHRPHQARGQAGTAGAGGRIRIQRDRASEAFPAAMPSSLTRPGTGKGRVTFCKEQDDIPCKKEAYRAVPGHSFWPEKHEPERNPA